MKVLVTGSRDHDPEWVRDQVVRWVRENAPAERVTVIHGDAPGADWGAHLASQSITECAEVRVPAQWTTFGKPAGPRRNAEMLEDYQPDVVLAFPLGESRGTRDCIAQATRRGVEVLVYEEV
jgi:hypothetical protein